MLIVLKVSGHLYRFPHKVRELVDVITTIIDGNVGIVVIPGGSVFADAVKEFQLSSNIDDDLAHWMAIKAMEVYGVFIKGFSHKAIEVYSLHTIHEVLENKLIPIVMPYKILREHDELPHSWAITSDSISIYIAYLLKADMIVLGKMVDGITDSNGSILRTVRVNEVYQYATTLFDEYTPILLKNYRIPLAIFNITKPWILHKIVKREPDNYTLIIP